MTTLAMTTLACVHPRDFRSPVERVTEHSAYTEHARVRLSTDLLASEPQQLIANLGLTATPVRSRLSFSLNLAHATFGILSVRSKFTFYESRWYAIGGLVGFSYLNPQTLWVLPKTLRQELGTFNLASAPIELWQSFPINHWFGLHLGMSYRSAALWGSYNGDALIADTNMAQRAFSFHPYFDFFVAQRIALRFGARLPAFAQFVEATEATAEVEPGLIVGFRSVEWVRRPLSQTMQFDVSAETRFGRNTHLRLTMNIWAFRPLDKLAVTPSLSLYWRFQ